MDSGAELSCISQVYFNEIQAKRQIPTLPVTGVTVVGAVGRRAKKVKQQAMLKINVDGKNIESCFLIVEGLVVPIVIGADWMDENGADLIHSRREVHITFNGKKEAPCILQMINNDNEMIRVHYIGIGLIYDKELYDNNSCLEALSNAIIIKRIMNLSIDKQRALDKAKESVEKPTPEKIRKIVSEIKGLKGKHKRALIKILIDNISVFSNKPGLVKDFAYEIKVKSEDPVAQFS